MASSRARDPAALLELLGRGDRPALARLLSLAESDPSAYRTIAAEVMQLGKGAVRVGITGSAGVGKSTILDQLSRLLRARGRSVGILATDPSSERTGGALLGDRVRLSAAEPDPGLYFRSASARGAGGGLGHAIHDQLDLLDAFGLELLLVEAVGAGQSEMEIARAADLVVLVLTPESGDDVQAMKAGLMEVGDVFCINKVDLPGAERAVQTLRAALELRAEPGELPPVCPISALEGRGVDALADAVTGCAARLAESGRLAERRRERRAHRVRALALRLLSERLFPDGWRRLLDTSSSRSPHRLAEELVKRICRPHE